MAGEALSHVQAARLKGSAIVFRRFLNSPVTSIPLVTPKKGVKHMRFFVRRKPVNSLHQATQLLNAAMEIIWQHQRTPSYRPTADDFKTLNHLRTRLWQANNEVEYITGSLHQRIQEKSHPPHMQAPQTTK